MTPKAQPRAHIDTSVRPPSYRWTLDEYVLRCALYDDVAEVLVEGDLDVDFYSETLERNGVIDVLVRDADYIHVTDDEVRDAHFSTGAKGRLLAVGAALAARVEAHGPLLGRVAIVVDRDWDGCPDELSAFVVATDGYSIENYAFTSRSIERFIRTILGRSPRPAGAKGGRPERRTTVSPCELLERLMPPAIEMAAVRRVLRAYSGVGVIQGWIKHFKVDKTGRFTASTAQVVLASLAASDVAPHRAVQEALADERTSIAADPRLLVRGHDLVALLHKLLKSSWGATRTSINFAGIEEHMVRRWLVTSMHPADIDGSDLVPNLITRLT